MKNKLQKVGLAVTSAAAFFVTGTVANAATLGDVLHPDSMMGGNLGYDALVKNMVNLVFILAAAMTFFYLVFGAINWITSGGDKGKVEAARNKITAAVIGLLILAATWAIFTLLGQLFFGQDITQVNLPEFRQRSKTGAYSFKKHW